MDISEYADIDLIVGLPSYNEYDSIAQTAQRVDEGLQKYFPNKSSLIVNVDNSPNQRTKRAFLNSKTRTKKLYLHSKAARGCKGTNLKKLFEFFLNTKARALTIIDADVVSNDPIWIKFFFEPIIKKRYDHIFPLYRRHQFDGSITNFICYPIVSGALGHAIRQPIGGEMSFSRKAVKNFLRYRWSASAHRYGVDIFMTLVSIFSEMKMGSVYLGVKRHKPSGPKLNNMFIDVVWTLFWMLRGHPHAWKRHLRLHKYPMLNTVYKQARNGKLEIDASQLVVWAKKGIREEQDILKKLVDPILLKRLSAKKGMYITAEEWIALVYRFLLAPKKFQTIDLVHALRPLYFIRFLTYCQERPSRDYAKSMRIVENQSDLFFEKRGEFLF